MWSQSGDNTTANRSYGDFVHHHHKSRLHTAVPLPATIHCVRYLAIPRRPYLSIAILSTAIDCASYPCIAIVSDNHVALTERLRQTATRTACWGRELDYVTDNTIWASQETDKVSESSGATAFELGLEKQKRWPRHNPAHANIYKKRSKAFHPTRSRRDIRENPKAPTFAH